MSRLIAQVATVVVVDGNRTVIPAGQPLPDDLPEHDKQELQVNRLAVLEDADAKAEAAAKAEEAKAKRAFEAEKKAIAAAQESVQPAKATPLTKRTKAG